MATITQDMKYKQSLMKYAAAHGYGITEHDGRPSHDSDGIYSHGTETSARGKNRT